MRPARNHSSRPKACSCPGAAPNRALKNSAASLARAGNVNAISCRATIEAGLRIQQVDRRVPAARRHSRSLMP
jgi:hypothetical protein